MRTNSARSLLRTTGWLSATPPSFQEAVLDRIIWREMPKGQPVYRHDDASGGLWALVDGELEFVLPGPENAPSFAHLATPGFWFGEGTVIYPSNRRVGVSTSRRSALAHLALADCHAILTQDPSAWRWIALQATMTSDLALRLAADLLLRDPTKRTAAMLLRLGGLRNGAFLADSPVAINLSQEKLGQLVNLSRNAMNMILRDFVERGFIEMRYRSIIVSDPVSLVALLSR